MAEPRWRADPRVRSATTLVLLLAMVVWHAVNNWLWLKRNVTLLGWDVPSHLGTSYLFSYMLRPLTPKTLFAAIVWHPNRPPLPFLAAVPFYRLFGVSPDVGTMVNVLYLAVLFGSVYGIGRQLGGRRVGLLAAFIVATLPMIYAISRFFYLELALTAMVSLSICLLLRTSRFEHRALSLLFGISVGLGLLTKRTYPVFVVAPLALVVARSAVVDALKHRLSAGLHVDAKNALLSLGLGLFLATAWYLPSREIAGQLPLGAWLVPIWALLIAVTLYLLRLPSGPDTNLLSALFLGGIIGSLWYLPRITFFGRLLAMGFGVNDPRDRSAGLGQLSTYFYFPGRLIVEHLSLVTFVLLGAAILGLLWSLRRRGSLVRTLRQAGDAWWVTMLWVAAAYLILTLSIYRKSRGITPVLPALALILAAGLYRLPWKRVRVALAALAVGWGLVQFAVLSYDSPHRLAEQTLFSVPLLGEMGLFAQGGTIQLPAAGDTDPGYWIEPELLQSVESERKAAAAGPVKLGVLVNNEHINPDLLGLLALQSYPGIQIQNLASTDSAESVYPQLFDQDYLVLIDGDYLLIDTAAQEALRHLNEAPGFFEATFEPAGKFPLPDGDTVLLYRKVHRSTPGAELGDYQAVAETITTLGREGDAILVVPPEQVEALGRSYQGSLPPYLLPAQQPLIPDETARTLEELGTGHSLLFAVFGEGTADPERFVEQWLNERAYRGRSEWHGPVQLVTYGAPAPGDEKIEHRPAACDQQTVRLGDEIQLLGYRVVEESVAPGRMVRLTLFWQADRPIVEPYTVFAHLVDSDGRLVAQQDGAPAGGSRPTTTWATHETIVDHVGVLVPEGTTEGTHRLVVGMYRPGTGERLAVACSLQTGGDGATDKTGEPVGDSVDLDTTIWVQGS